MASNLIAMASTLVTSSLVLLHTCKWTVRPLTKEDIDFSCFLFRDFRGHAWLPGSMLVRTCKPETHRRHSKPEDRITGLKQHPPGVGVERETC